MGSIPYNYFEGSSHFVTFVDDYARKVCIYAIKRKVVVFNVFKHFRVLVEKETGMTIKCLRTDNEGEFTSLEFEKYCKEVGLKGIKPWYTLLGKMAW